MRLALSPTLALSTLFSTFFLAALGAAEPSPNGFPPLIVPAGLGVNIHFTKPKPGEIEMLADAGFRWVRMDFSWGGTEREMGRYDFIAYDRLLTALEAHKIRAIWILDYSNPFYDHGVSPASDGARRAFARWAAAAARHFRGHGIVWEMYNEPNIGFWKPKPDVKQYAKLALDVGRAMRTAAPNELYIGPATSTVDFKFLESCFHDGLLEYWSAVSVHPYRQTDPETVAADYARLRKLIDRFAPKGKQIPIISGEWGYSAAWKKYDEERQGKYLPREMIANLVNDVPISIWYDWHDDGVSAKEPEHHFGTVHSPYNGDRQPVYDEKPAYRAAKTFSTVLAGCRYMRRIATASQDDHILVFENEESVRLAAWTVATSAHSVRVVVKPGRYPVTGHTGEAMPAIEADSNTSQGPQPFYGISIPLTDAPQYISMKKGDLTPDAGP